MRNLFAVCLAASLTWPVTAAEPDPEPPQDIQGTWSMASAVERGKAVPAEELKGGKFVIGKGKLTMSLGEKCDNQFSYKLDTTAKPKAIDLTQDGKTTAGIYKLEGDTLTVCLPQRGSTKRPDTFDAKEGSGLTVITLKRGKGK